jgi:hypothetical protein
MTGMKRIARSARSARIAGSPLRNRDAKSRYVRRIVSAVAHSRECWAP